MLPHPAFALPAAFADARADGAPFPYAVADATSGAAGVRHRGGTLELAVRAVLEPWDPARPAGGWLAVARLVQEPLLTLEFGAAREAYAPRPRPALATAWERTADGLLHTFALRDHVLWAGEAAAAAPLAAADVVASLRAALERAGSPPPFDPATALAAPDARTVTLRLPRPDADLLVALAALPIAPPGAAPGPAGSGPFAVERVEGFTVRLRAHAAHWRGAPALDGISVRSGMDGSAQGAAFAAGVLAVGDALPQSVADAEALLRERPEAVVSAAPVLAAASSWAFDLADPRFADERVRRALSLALDRAHIRERAHGGYARHVPAQAWPFVFDRLPTGAALGAWQRHDPTEARALLAAAGPTQLAFTVAYSTDAGRAAEHESLLMVAMLRASGVDARLERQPAVAFAAGWRDASFVGAADGRAVAAPSASAFFHDQLVSRRAGAPSANPWRIADAQLDAWAVAQRAELDPYARRDLLRRIWERLQDRIYRLDKAQPFPLAVRPAWLHGWDALTPFAATDAPPARIGASAHTWIDSPTGGS